MPALRVTTLQWAMGAFCATLGALMLVAPHQFASPAYAAFQPRLPWWAAAFLLGGGALVAVACLHPRGWPRLVVHVVAGALLLLLALGFVPSGVWTGVYSYALIALGVLAVPWVRRAPADADDAPDLFTILMALVAAGLGVLFVIAAPLGSDINQDSPLQPYGLPLGIAFLLVSGALLLICWPRLPLPLRWALVLAAASVFLFTGLLGSFARRRWIGFIFFAEMSVVLALLPWLGPWLARIDARSLRTRLALALVVASALPLLVTLALLTERTEQAVVADALQDQQQIASLLARDAGDYLGLHRAAVATLAGLPDVLALPPETQRRALQAYGAAYPDAESFALLDAAGNPVAYSGEQRSRALGGLESIAGALRATAPISYVVASEPGQPVFGFAAPIRTAAGDSVGVAASTLTTDYLAALLADTRLGTDSAAYLFDDTGQLIARSDDASPRVASADVEPLLARALAADELSGAWQEGGNQGRLVSYARVPGVPWLVLTERPVAGAVASALVGRELAFGLLFAVVALAALAGALVADRLAAPLAGLARAVTRLAAGDSAAPLPRGGITEIDRLAADVGAMRDALTVQRIAREGLLAELRAEQARLRAIIEQMPAGVAIADAASGEVLLSNARFAETLGRPAWPIGGAPPGGRPLASHTDGRPLKKDEWPLARVLRSAEEIDSIELALRRDDGTTATLSASAAPIRGPDGSVVAAVVAFHDISDRKRAEDAQRFLAEASRVLAASLDYADTAAALVRLVVPPLADWCLLHAPDADGHVQLVAQAHRDPAREAELRALHERYPLDPDLPYFAPHVLRTGQSELYPTISAAALDAVAVDDDHRAALAALGPRSAMVVPLVARGRTLGALTLASAESAREFTAADLALAEDLARRAALALDNARLYHEAREAIRARDEFLSIASHELRTPITSLQGYAQWLSRARERGGLPAEKLDWALSAIAQSSARLTTLIQDLLDVSRLRADRLEFQPHELDLTALLRAIAARYTPRLSNHILVCIGTKKPCPVIGDPDRLDQVLTNLLDNAIKYSPEGGEIELRLVCDEAGAEVQVCDRGIGLPPDSAETIFEPFGRAPNAAARQLPGMGLGLYICRQIVERHGGRLWAHSAGEDQGTTFSLWLPLAGAPAAVPEARGAHG